MENARKLCRTSKIRPVKGRQHAREMNGWAEKFYVQEMLEPLREQKVLRFSVSKEAPPIYAFSLWNDYNVRVPSVATEEDYKSTTLKGPDCENYGYDTTFASIIKAMEEHGMRYPNDSEIFCVHSQWTNKVWFCSSVEEADQKCNEVARFPFMG